MYCALKHFTFMLKPLFWIDRVAGIILTEEDTFVADRQYFVSVKIEADAVGVTLEEYVDRFLEVFYEDACNLHAIIKRN